MKWFSAVSFSQNWEAAVHELVEKNQRSMEGDKPHLAVLFVTPHHEKSYKKIHQAVSKQFPSAFLIGCSGGGIIGGNKEVESEPAISLMVAHLPNVKIHPFRVADEELPDLDGSPKAWHKVIGVEPDVDPQFVILSDPFSIQIENFVRGMDYAYPKSVKIGGLASGAMAPGGNALFLNEQFSSSGLIGLAFSGDIVISPLVAQGCRPIGPLLRVTACDRNILLAVDDQPPLMALQEMYESLTPRDQNLLQSSLFLGIVSDSNNGDPGPGDFLIRNIVNADTQRGYIGIGALLRVGQSVQFHLRDAETSHQDLKHVLERYVARPELYNKDLAQSQGVMLFSCAGRGSYLYGEANHDTNLFGRVVGNLPISGFFCNGEIGPVGQSTYVHGYTSCFGVFQPKEVKA